MNAASETLPYPQIADRFAADNWDDVGASARQGAFVFVFEDGMYGVGNHERDFAGYSHGPIVLRAPLRRYRSERGLRDALVRVAPPRLPQDLLKGDPCWVRDEPPLTREASRLSRERSRWQPREVVSVDRRRIVLARPRSSVREEIVLDGHPRAGRKRHAPSDVAVTEAQRDLRAWTNAERASVADAILRLADDGLLARVALLVRHEPPPPALDPR